MKIRITCRGRACDATWIAKVMYARTENVPGCGRSLAHPRKPSANAMWCLTCRSGIGAGIVWLGGVTNVDIRSIQGTMNFFPLVCIDYGYLSVVATPMLVARDRRTGMVFALPVERREPKRVARRAGSVTILEISALGDNAGNGLAKRAVGPVAGMVRTLEKELEFNCRMQRLPESMTIVWIMVHTTTMLNLDTVGCGEKVPFERWRGRGHHMGRCVLGNECGIEWVHSQVERRPRTDGIWHIR